MNNEHLHRIILGAIQDEGYSPCHDLDSEHFYMEIHCKTEKEAELIYQFLVDLFIENLEKGKMMIKHEVLPFVEFDDVFNYFIDKKFGSNGDSNMIN